MLLYQKGNKSSKLHLKSEGSENNAVLLESVNGGVCIDSVSDISLDSASDISLDSGSNISLNASSLIDLKRLNESIISISYNSEIDLRKDAATNIIHESVSAGDDFTIKQKKSVDGALDIKLSLESDGSAMKLCRCQIMAE